MELNPRRTAKAVGYQKSINKLKTKSHLAMKCGMLPLPLVIREEKQNSFAIITKLEKQFA